MPVKNFIVTKLPTRARILISGVPVVIGQAYPTSESSNITIQNLTGFKAAPMDAFYFVIEVDGIRSKNEGKFEIAYNTAAGEPTAVAAHHESIQLFESRFLSDMISYENKFDRISISSISGKGTWKIESNPILPGDVIFWYDIFNRLEFVSDQEGAKNQYNTLQFYFGNKDGFFSYKNSVIIDTSSLAELKSDLSIRDIADETLFIKQFFFNIEKQLQGKDFTLRFTTAISSIATGGVYISYDEENLEIHTNGNQTLTANNPNDDGRIRFLITVKSTTNFVSGDNFKVNLVQIDGSASFVNTSKNELTFNL